MTNPFLALTYEPALESLGDDFYDPVPAASFPQQILRFRNDAVLPQLGLNPKNVDDQDFIEAFGLFEGVRPFLALRYHGHQIAGYGQVYNPELGDGRGFLYGQVRGVDGQLYDFGTKGSGQTPYSRRGDGRLTLKGGVREVLAAEALHSLGVKTSRCFSVVETGEELWRGDEPSPTRSAVMVRFSRSHIRFGTFERLRYCQRPDLISKLLDHVIETYYPAIDADGSPQDRYAAFFSALVDRVAQLVAQWMAAGFCHGVLNTDNMSITGESFDYGPFAFMPAYNPRFTAAYFDYEGFYCFGNQPAICRSNLEKLKTALSPVVLVPDMESALETYGTAYADHYITLMLRRLGIVEGTDLDPTLAEQLINQTLTCLATSQTEYPSFFAMLRQTFNQGWRESPDLILENADLGDGDWDQWRLIYQQSLAKVPPDHFDSVGSTLQQANPLTDCLRPRIETVWAAIAEEDNWQPFDELVQKLQTGH
ncbi:MAG: YdiU family protein [Synechocystis sp.]|nr:YdiU family protein [Synechocystis sp.]